MRLHGVSFLIPCSFLVAVACSKPLPNCEQGEPLGERVFVTSEDVPMHTLPSASSPRVVNAKATAVLGTVQYRSVSSSYGLLGLCVLPGWTQVEIVEADAQPVEWETGWIAAEFLSGTQSAEQQAGLLWNPTTDTLVRAEDRAAVRANALRVLSEDPNCGAIIFGAYSGESPGHFYVMCRPKNGKEVYNVFFSAQDSASAGALRAPAVIDVSRGRTLCEAAIRAEASVPSSVELHSVVGFATTEHTNGNRTIVQGFRASNALGQKEELVARCLVQPNGETEITISAK